MEYKISKTEIEQIGGVLGQYKYVEVVNAIQILTKLEPIEEKKK